MVNTYWACRYRARAGTVAYGTMGDRWSDWYRPPALAEGWIQRVLSNVTPFNQRMTDLYCVLGYGAASFLLGLQKILADDAQAKITAFTAEEGTLRLTFEIREIDSRLLPLGDRLWYNVRRRERKDMPVTELGVDEQLARAADRKLRRYGSALDDCLNSVLLTIIRMPGMRSFSVSREGDSITCSFPYPFRAFGRNYIANVTAENEGFSAEVPELPGCLTEAYSIDELKRNLPEAVECWLGGAEDLRRAQTGKRTKVA